MILTEDYTDVTLASEDTDDHDDHADHDDHNDKDDNANHGDHDDKAACLQDEHWRILAFRAPLGANKCCLTT